MYTQQQKDTIKANPLNRENSRNIRVIATRKYREFQAAGVALESAGKHTTEKRRKELTANLLTAKADYEEALNKIQLYKEIFPDIVT